jgi:hypothetical protein
MKKKERADLMARMSIDLPDRQSGNLRVEHFTVGEDLPDMIRSFQHYGDRMPDPGTYIRLMEGPEPDSVVWMSNTPAELEDHLPVLQRASQPDIKTALVTGLGLGCVIKGLASFDHIEHIDVVEYNRDVIDLTGDQFALEGLADRIRIHHASAYTFPPRRQHWDLAWHDIWPDISTDNLHGMYDLWARFRGHARIQGFWALNLCRRQWEYEEMLFDMVKAREGKYPREGHPLWVVYHTWKKESEYVHRITTITDDNNLENK